MGKKSKKRQLEVESQEGGRIPEKSNDVGKDLPKNKKMKKNKEIPVAETKNQDSNTKVHSPKKNRKEHLVESPTKAKKRDASTDQNESSPKKKKLNKSSDDSSSEKKQTSEAPIDADSSLKELKKKKKKNKNAAKLLQNGESSTTDKTENEKTEKSPEKVISSKRKEMFKQKRKDFKEKKKALGIKSETDLSKKFTLEEMKKRITEIQSRETLTNTAKKKLAMLTRKVRAQEEAAEKPETTAETSLPSKGNTQKQEKNLKKQQENKVPKKSIDSSEAENGDVDKSEKSEENDQHAEKLGNKKSKKQKKTKAPKGTDDSSNTEDAPLFVEDRVGDTSLNAVESEDEEDDDSDTNANDQYDKLVKGSDDDEVKPKKLQSNKSKFDKQKPNEPAKKRFVLFIGNVAYETTTVDLKKHFLTKVSKVTDVRIPLNPGTKNPRGFAYVEVENSEDYERALSLHGSVVAGRKIKVEYTTSGSKHASKKQEIVHKNQKLHAMRRAGMLAGSKKPAQKRSFRRNFKNKSEN